MGRAEGGGIAAQSCTALAAVHGGDANGINGWVGGWVGASVQRGLCGVGECETRPQGPFPEGSGTVHNVR